MHENYAARPHPEYVVLDIGDDLGALIVYTDAALHGTEVEISPDGRDEERSHKDVLERAVGERPAFTAVFDRLPEGAYTLWTGGVARARGVRVAGGAVAELDWTAAAVPAGG
jgi:hypothetical protein